MIKRLGTTPRYADATVFMHLTHAVEVPATETGGISEQMTSLLDSLERTLAKAGSDKSRLLMATIYLIDMADYDRVMAINLRSQVVLTGLALPHIAARGGGAVLLISSLSGLRGNGRINAYALAKAGVAQLARNLAVEWGPRNVRVNAISPGFIATELSASLLADEAFMTRRIAQTPLRRPGTPAGVAGAALFLASPAGAFVTGHNLVVDGGTLISDGS